ncbi:ectonucleotide pyrophosphatase/phosphodiesterase [Rheinheimera sp. WS51]|uniref:alkaline phosphatase family protein n=1 Tax=Rheinheimera sp. WS51 TaxID=3425886 RepID=UPI003D9117B4
MYKWLILILLILATPLKAEQGTVILISIDGFAATYLAQYPAPTLKTLVEKGLTAESMQPVFPSKTFPNHYSIVTGLYPAQHGIIENSIYDPEFKSVFRINKPKEVTDARWWFGEPIWVTAELQGVKAATYFYPGSEAAIKQTRPSYWQVYDGKVSNIQRVNSVLDWLDLPKAQRPHFITLYFSSVDDAGHRFGPNSNEVKDAIIEVDQAIGHLMAGLKQRGIDQSINLMITSDHGMAEVPAENSIVIDRYINYDDIEQALFTAEIVSIFPKANKLESVYKQLTTKLPAQATVYKKSELPARWQYKDNQRIAPLIVVPELGWRLIKQQHLARWQARQGEVSGNHGYDNAEADMQAIFIGHGPAFKAGTKIPSFSNIELYNLMCKILKITPADNAGNPAWAEQILNFNLN